MQSDVGVVVILKGIWGKTSLKYIRWPTLMIANVIMHCCKIAVFIACIGWSWYLTSKQLIHTIIMYQGGGT